MVQPCAQQAATHPNTVLLSMQLLEAAQRWCARHEPPAVAALGPAAHNPCLAGSSISNTRISSGPSWHSADTLPAVGEAPAGDASSSGRSSEEGSSAAWRLAAWLQRQGWPVQHCASFRSGRSGAGGDGAGWRFTSGHEFVLLYPHHCSGAPDPGGGADPPSDASPGSGGGSAGGDIDAQFADMAADMACDAPAIVVDPEFATQFALTSPTPRYQVRPQLHPPRWRCGGTPAAQPPSPAFAESPEAPACWSRMLCSSRGVASASWSHAHPAFPPLFASLPSAVPLMSPPAQPFFLQLVMMLLPRVFVGTHERLQRLVEWACREMRACFQDSGSGVPPWRSLGHVLSKWRLQGGSRSGSPLAQGEEQGERQAALHAASPPAVQQEQRGTPTGPASAPAACGAAFSAEQQQAMRSLLLHSPVSQQAQQVSRCAVPSSPCAPPPPSLSAHSSVSSMDTAPLLASLGAAASPASPAAPPRSLLTAELQQMSGVKQVQEQGPAAAILSLAYGSGQTASWR